MSTVYTVIRVELTQIREKEDLTVTEIMRAVILDEEEGGRS